LKAADSATTTKNCQRQEGQASASSLCGNKMLGIFFMRHSVGLKDAEKKRMQCEKGVGELLGGKS